MATMTFFLPVVYFSHTGLTLQSAPFFARTLTDPSL